MTAVELLDYFHNGMESPDDIFKVYDEFQNLSDEEKEKFRNSGIGDAVSMRYITAKKMKQEGIWESYLEEWKNKKNRK